MALIKCPECGHDVSDKAASCPNCGFAVAANRPDGTVRIKMTPFPGGSFIGRQRVTLSAHGQILWEGYAGQIAEVYFDRATYVHVRYHTNMAKWGVECSGDIDPAKGKSYSIQTVHGFIRDSICLQRVDVIDSD